MYIVGYSEVDACLLDINEEAFQMAPSNFPNRGNFHSFTRSKRAILKGVWMLYANKNVESVGEKTIETNKLGPIKSLLNHMDLNNEININSPINTTIRE